MIRRLARLLLRLVGWLLTPIAVTLAAAVGAIIGTMVAPTLSPTAGVGVTAGLALVTGGVGLWLWLRLIRTTPALQTALAVTADGVPTEDAIEDLVHPEPDQPPTP